MKLSKTANTAVAKAVKSVLRRQTETKFSSVTQDLSFNSTITSASECYALMPRITGGTNDNQRIGDKITGRYLYIKGHLQYNASFINATGNNYVPPSTCRILILTQKQVKANSQMGTIDTAHLLKDNVGTGVARAYVGTMTDNLAPINKDLFKVYMDKKVRLRAIHQLSDGTGTGMMNGLPTIYWSCRIKLPKTLTFDDSNGDFVNNFCPFICMGSVLEDGTSPWSASTPYRLTFLSTAYYEDA